MVLKTICLICDFSLNDRLEMQKPHSIEVHSKNLDWVVCELYLWWLFIKDEKTSYQQMHSNV